jgi:beta-lactamase class A
LIAYCAVDLVDGRTAQRDGDAVLPSASTIKLLVSMALWRAVHAGTLAAGRRFAAAAAAPVGGLLQALDPATELTAADLDLLMLSVSDNAATNLLVELVGFDAVNAEAARLGLAATRLRRLMGDQHAIAAGRENTTSAADMAAVAAALWRERHARTLASLARSEHTDIIPRYLPAGCTVHCKQGELEGRVRHDVAVIDGGGRTVAMALLSSPPAAADALARLASGLYADVLLS